MVSMITRIDTSHQDMIHDAQMDYYGSRLATCSSDRMVKIFDVKPNGQHQFITDLQGHEGPIWQVTWSHPMFGNLLASCSYDRKVIVWKENSPGRWIVLYEYTDHDASVNSIQFAPPEYGLMLAACSSDGSVSVISQMPDGSWQPQKISNAHSVGCNAVSWAPSTAPGSLLDPSRSELSDKYLVTGGCDNLVKIWKLEGDTWEEKRKLQYHTDWVRDVAWAPSIGLPNSTIASCSQDHSVVIWRCSDSADPAAEWTPTLLAKFDDVVWHVSWSICGSILAVSGGDNKVSLWKEGIDGTWQCISDTAKSGATEKSR